MGEGVQADLVPLADHVLHDAGVPGDHGTHEEERAVRIVVREDLEDLLGVRGVGTVVEGEHDGLLRNGLRPHGTIRRRQDRPAVEDALRHLVVGRVGADAVVAQYLGPQISVEQHHADESQDENEREDDAWPLQSCGPAPGAFEAGGSGAATAPRGGVASHVFPYCASVASAVADAEGAGSEGLGEREGRVAGGVPCC